MQVPVPIRRLVYRVGYRVLQVLWLVTRPTLRGAKCLLIDGNRVLLVRHTYGRRWWDLPGGTIQRGECPQRAARREMHEELGLEIDWVPAGQLEIRNRGHTDHLYCFWAERGQPPIRIDRGELQEARWFDRRALPQDLSPQVPAILSLVPALSGGTTDTPGQPG